MLTEILDMADIKPGVYNFIVFWLMMELSKLVGKLLFSSAGGRFYVRGLTELVDL